MKERRIFRRRGLFIQMPGLITGGFLQPIPLEADGDTKNAKSFELPTRTTMIKDAEIHYLEFGVGEPVIFVHGSLGDCRAWGYQMEVFAESYRMISYSRRYHHPNIWVGDGSDYSTGLHADDLACLIEKLSVGPAHIVGMSTGGVIALLVARDRPDLVRTLSVCEPDLTPWLTELPGGTAVLESFVKGCFEPAKAAVQMGDIEAALKHFIDPQVPGWYAQATPEELRLVWDNVPEFKLELAVANFYSPFSFQDAASIETPTLLLGGENSLDLYRICDTKLEQLMPNVERVIVPGTSHAAHYLAPELFNKTVLAFLKRHCSNSTESDTLGTAECP